MKFARLYVLAAMFCLGIWTGFIFSGWMSIAVYKLPRPVQMAIWSLKDATSQHWPASGIGNVNNWHRLCWLGMAVGPILIGASCIRQRFNPRKVK